MKKIIVYPAGKWAKELLTLSRSETVAYFLDGDGQKQKDGFPVCNGVKPVFPVEYLRNENPDDIIVLISDSHLYHDCKATLETFGLVENIHFFNAWKLDINFYRFYENHANWKEYEQDFDIDYSRYEDRAKIMSTLIPGNVRSVMDLGCGDEKLRKYLPRDVKYFGIDTVKRGDDTVICDINAEALPELKADAYYMAGFLPYVNDIRRLFSQMKRGKYIIFDVANSAQYQRLDARSFIHGMRFVMNSRDDFLRFSEIINILSDLDFMVEKAIHPPHSESVWYCRARNLRLS